MKLQVAILSMLLPISSFAGAINCNLHVYNKNTHESSSVELKPIDSNKMYFVLSAELSEFGASYGSNLLGNTESLVIADAEGVMSSMEV